MVEKEISNNELLKQVKSITKEVCRMGDEISETEGNFFTMSEDVNRRFEEYGPRIAELEKSPKEPAKELDSRLPVVEKAVEKLIGQQKALDQSLRAMAEMVENKIRSMERDIQKGLKETVDTVGELLENRPNKMVHEIVFSESSNKKIARAVTEDLIIALASSRRRIKVVKEENNE